MRRTFRRLAAALVLLALGAAACSDSPTASEGRKEKGEAELGFSMNLSGTSVNTLVVQVTAADIATPLAFNIPVVNGTATGSITIPAGTARTITMRAYDARGTLTHEGSRTVDVKAGTSAAVSVTLVPLAGDVVVTANFGSLVVRITRAGSAPTYGYEAGDSVRLTGTVTQPDGAPVAGARVRWASLNPSVAMVDSAGVVTARAPGTADIVATYAGYGASATITVAGDGTNGTTDRTAPRLVSFSVTPDTANMSGGNVEVTFTVKATDAGTGAYSMSAQLTSPDGTTSRECSVYESASTAGTAPATLSCSITLSQYSAAGRWTITSLGYGDRANNGRSYTHAQLVAAGLENAVVVTNARVDNAPPVLTNMAFSPDTVYGYGQATLRIQATDVASGIERIEAFGRSQSSPDGSTFNFNCNLDRPVAPGLWECYVMIDSYVPAGVLAVEAVRLVDVAGNSLFLNPSDLAARGINARVTVVR